MLDGLSEVKHLSIGQIEFAQEKINRSVEELQVHVERIESENPDQFD